MKSRNKKMFKVGPIGSNHSYRNWDEKGGSMISFIYLAYNKEAIKSIQFKYRQNGGHDVVSKKYGSSDKGVSHKIVRLNSDEYVTGLSAIDCLWITSLNIHTNQGKHGPFCHSFSSSIFLQGHKRKIKVGIRDPREFGGFFGSFDVSGKLSSIGMYVCPITRFNDAPLGSNYKVTDVDDDDDQPTLYQSYDHPLATVNHNGTREDQMPHDHEVSDGYNVKAIVHKPKFEDKMSLYQSSDHRLARSTNNRTLEYQMPHEFSDGYHVKPFGRTPKLKDGIFSKLGRLFICA